MTSDGPGDRRLAAREGGRGRREAPSPEFAH